MRTLKEKCFIVNEILIEVIATELVRDNLSGVMKEVKIEDRNHPACLFAAKFTELYPGNLERVQRVRKNQADSQGEYSSEMGLC